MNIRWLLLGTHVIAAAISGTVVTAGFVWGGVGGLIPTGVLAALAAAGLAGLAAGRIRHGLNLVERSLECDNLEDCRSIGVREIARLADRLRDQSQHWANVTAGARQQGREVETLLAQLSRRGGPGRSPVRESSAGHQVRQLLGSLAKAATNDLQRLLASADEIERRTQEMASGAEQQSDAVSQTTTSVEQMSTHIDSVSQNADATNVAAQAARESAAGGLDLVRELIRGMDRIRLHVEAGQKKLRALGERSHEIGSIVETIGTISARTDMLALNASIESVRSGEHGRGFAVVAEEVRKLAEQTAQAAREVSALIESIQVETQESIAAMADEHAEVAAEVQRVNEAGVTLERISRTSSDSAQRVGEISRATLHQLRVTQEVALAMQRISEVARGIRSRADGVCWTTRMLTQLVRQLETSLSPLRNCVDGEPAVQLDSVSPGARDDAKTTGDGARHPIVPQLGATDTRWRSPVGLVSVSAEEGVNAG